MDLTKFIGLPYKDHGRSREGMDCWGMCVLFYREVFQVELPLLTDEYLSAEDGESVAGCVDKARVRWLEVQEPEFGDVLLFRIMGWPTHVGIYIGNGDFLHALKGSNSCIDRIRSLTWKSRHIRTYRWQTE